MLNLVVDYMDEPNVTIETKETIDRGNLDWFKKCMATGNVELMSQEDGLKRLEEYVGNFGGSLDAEWAEKKAEFLEQIKDKVGMFYIWNVEDDVDLMFVEQGEVI